MQQKVSSTPAEQIHYTAIVRELPADLETPVSVYLKVRGHGPSFMLESVTGGEQLARYSFIGVLPGESYVLRQGEVQIHHHRRAGDAQIERVTVDGDPLAFVQAKMQRYSIDSAAHLPRFAGGVVGYVGYEMIRFFEPSLALEAHADLPDGIFLFTDTYIAFDHAFGRLLLIGNADPNATDESAPAQVNRRLDQIEAWLRDPLPSVSTNNNRAAAGPLHANQTELEYANAVLKAKEYIAAGDIFQVVLSQKLDRETDIPAFDLYRSLRRLNPSPYMFFFDFDHLIPGPTFHLIGASPEIHVRLENGLASVRPIAGTRQRGSNPAEDLALEQDLLADPKERAEHVMLVDLGRNDLGRICEYGSIQIPEQMVVERYSHVMHIVSHVQGRLKAGMDAFDLLRATFPAGTVSGAPKIRAMQIIRELEPEPRGPYAGAVGYFSFDGSMDTCITIRTLVMRGNRIYLQSGAGIVADSDPVKEYQETLNKLNALFKAVEKAEGSEAI